MAKKPNAKPSRNHKPQKAGGKRRPASHSGKRKTATEWKAQLVKVAREADQSAKTQIQRVKEAMQEEVERLRAAVKVSEGSEQVCTADTSADMRKNFNSHSLASEDFYKILHN